MDLLTVEVAGQTFALPLEHVREIVRAVAITRLSGAPTVIEGIVDVRGEVVPVLDLRRRFDLPGRGVQPSDHLVLAAAGTRTIALRVDRAIGVLLADEAALVGAESLAPGSRYLAGVARLTEGLVLIYDLPAFLSQVEAEALDRALGAVSAPANSAE